ncbi:hypothetical protein [Burkholderia ubonensis]|uniref:hypothetical protein n=1 Tax=Burkholderia ubonensis TaxID=101571 RepID=UPI00075E934A|nr:hypothetical protein WK99_29450 [Burkholderia ubonensis]
MMGAPLGQVVASTLPLWHINAASGGGVHPIRIDDNSAVLTSIANARVRCHPGADAPVYSCYEAGRDGFWLHRWLTEQGIINLVVDSASIEVNRRARRAKTDRLDSDKLLSMLMRYYSGERRVRATTSPRFCRIVGPPSPLD